MNYVKENEKKIKDLMLNICAVCMKSNIREL